MRSELPIQSPQRSEIEFNLLFFYKILQKATSNTENSEEVFNIKDRKDIDTCKKQAQ